MFYPTVDDEWQKRDDLKPTMTKKSLIKKLYKAKVERMERKKRRKAAVKPGKGTVVVKKVCC